RRADRRLESPEAESKPVRPTCPIFLFAFGASSPRMARLDNDRGVKKWTRRDPLLRSFVHEPAFEPPDLLRHPPNRRVSQPKCPTVSDHKIMGRNEPSRLDFPAEQDRRPNRHSMAGNGGDSVEMLVGQLEAELARSRLSQCVIPELPPIGAAEQWQRAAGLLESAGNVGRAEWHEQAWEKPERFESRPAAMAVADRRIEATVAEVLRFRRQVQLDLQSVVEITKTAQTRCQPTHAEGGKGGDRKMRGIDRRAANEARPQKLERADRLVGNGFSRPAELDPMRKAPEQGQ